MRTNSVTTVFLITLSVTLLALGLALSAIYVIQTPAIFWNNVTFTFAMILLITFPTALVVSKMSFDVVVLNKKLRDLIRYDRLTGALNKEEFFNDLREERTMDTGVALKMDVDNFKELSDTFGPTAADEVLKSVTEIMKIAVRDDDKVCRLGIEEFVVVLQSVTLDEGISIARRIQEMIAEKPVETCDSLVPVSVSVGAVSIEKNGDIENILRLAGRELEHAKHAGPNQLHVLKQTDPTWDSGTTPPEETRQLM